METAAKVLASRQERRRGNVYDANCPSRNVLDHVTSRWGSLVLLVLLDGKLRFSELARRIGGVSEKMLAQSLRTLETDGFLLRTVYPTIPPKVEYCLTPRGREAGMHIKTLTDWIEDNVSDVLQDHSKRAEVQQSLL
ncbi:winged helix-turn-helix transcriptional regulator [Granulicella arctica]|uniref:winged helix-turn-helix transcriptional regulator n=1 Tax=Granulicella arctica TaxID=940613 RepID=UPI0021DF41FC|nr:helix-turn-helix domain-containing protein [Granulicella arctica]